MSASGLLFFKVTQPGVVTPASHPSVWETDAKGPVLPAVLSQHLTPPASFFPGYLLHCPSSHPSSVQGAVSERYPSTHPAKLSCSIPGTLHCQQHSSFSTKASPAILQTYAPTDEKPTLLFFPHSFQGRRDPLFALSRLPFLISGTHASVTLVPPWTLGRAVLGVRSWNCRLVLCHGCICFL